MLLKVSFLKERKGMKKTLLTLIISSFFIISGCGGSDSDPVASKDLFSLWNKTGDSGVLNLEQSGFSQPGEINWYFSGGEQCTCNFLVNGSQQSGSYVMNTCSYQVNSGSSDPGCESLNQTGTYLKTNDTLTINSPNGVVLYQ